MFRRISILLLLVLCGVGVQAQQVLRLDLKRTIALANDSSLSAFRYQNMYLSGYWEYRSYKAARLPSLFRHNIIATSLSVTIRRPMLTYTVSSRCSALRPG